MYVPVGNVKMINPQLRGEDIREPETWRLVDSFGSSLRSAFSNIGFNFFYVYIVNYELAFQQLMPIDVRRNVCNLQGAQCALRVSGCGKAR